MIIAEWQVGQFVWSMVWLSFFFIWIWVIVAVFADLFRSPDLSGWAKAAWTLFLLVLPVLAMFVYLVARGGTITQRRSERVYEKSVVA